jgi:hypothetical protein
MVQTGWAPAQLASVANAAGSLVRTTHMTGPATDLGVALAFLLLRGTAPGTLYAARRTAILRASKMFAFRPRRGGRRADRAVPPLPLVHDPDWHLPLGGVRVFGRKGASAVPVGRTPSCAAATRSPRSVMRASPRPGGATHLDPRRSGPGTDGEWIHAQQTGPRHVGRQGGVRGSSKTRSRGSAPVPWCGIVGVPTRTPEPLRRSG